jgi:hypothetical protein
MTPEEAYMTKEQIKLQLHALKYPDTRTRIQQDHKSVNETLTEEEFVKILQSLNLLPPTNPMKPKQWTRFYKRIKSLDADKNELVIANIMVVFIAMSSMMVEDKARLLFNIMSEGKPERKLFKEEVQSLLVFLFKIVCDFIPYLASDYPQENKKAFLEIECVWK